MKKLLSLLIIVWMFLLTLTAYASDNEIPPEAPAPGSLPAITMGEIGVDAESWIGSFVAFLKSAGMAELGAEDFRARADWDDAYMFRSARMEHLEVFLEIRDGEHPELVAITVYPKPDLSEMSARQRGHALVDFDLVMRACIYANFGELGAWQNEDREEAMKSLCPEGLEAMVALGDDAETVFARLGPWTPITEEYLLRYEAGLEFLTFCCAYSGELGEKPKIDIGTDYLYTVADGCATIAGYVGADTELVIPDQLGGYPVTSIGDFAFLSLGGITSVVIPAGVTTIGDDAFDECDSLASIALPDTLTFIGEFAFNKCSSLTSIYIPDGVTSIGTGAFSGCSSLAQVELSVHHPVFAITEGVLFQKQENMLHSCLPGFQHETYTVPLGTQRIGDWAFSTCGRLTGIDIPDGVTSIGDNAFAECKNLTSVTLPDHLISIGAYAFSGCESLTDIVIPDGVTTIDSVTFFGCKSLASIAIPESVTEIGGNAFGLCESLTDIVIPENVTSIGVSAFEDCPNLMLTVAKGSYAEKYARENGIPYMCGEGDTSCQYLDSSSVNVVHPGQFLYIRLTENQTTPYRWYFSISNTTLVEYISDAYEMDEYPLDLDGVGEIFFI